MRLIFITIINTNSNLYLINYFYYNFFKKNQSIFFLLPVKKFRLNWLSSTKTNKYFDNNFFFKANVNYTIYQKNYINDFIFLKKKIGFLKKNNKINEIILKRIVFLKKDNKFANEILNDQPNFNKSLDLRYRIHHIMLNNRQILNHFINTKFIRQRKLSKLFKVLINSKYKFLQYFSLNLYKILIFSNFFFKEQDILYFIHNKYIFINNFNVSSEKFLVKQGDIISLSLDKNYYNFYKKTFSNYIYNYKKHLDRIARLYQNKTDLNKQKSTNIPEKYTKIKFFKNDVPKFLELDYVTLQCLVLYKSDYTNHLNYYDLKFYSFFLRRLYNWNYIN